MVSEAKKAYMKQYNRRPRVKKRKAEYMQRIRAEYDQQASRNLVSFLAEMGYEDLATEYAIERAPEMLISLRNRVALKG